MQIDEHPIFIPLGLACFWSKNLSIDPANRFRLAVNLIASVLLGDERQQQFLVDDLAKSGNVASRRFVNDRV
jgi:hypothetical protein